MSDTTSDTAAIDEKKESISGGVNANYTTNIQNFILYVVMIFIGLLIYFTSSSLILYGCKLAQSNILPTDSDCYPYTDENQTIDKIDINVFTKTIVDDNGKKEQVSMKINFPYDKYNSSNKLLDMFREYKNEPDSHFLANYFISVMESSIQFKYSAFNSVLNMLNGIPEFLIVLFGPIIFGIITAVVLLFDNIWLIFSWFQSMFWFFKTNTNKTDSGKPEWANVTLSTPVNYCIAIWLVIIFGFCFIFTMPVYFFLSLLLFNWLLFSSLTFKADMNAKPYYALSFIKDTFIYHKLPIISVLIFYVVKSAFSILGTTSGVFSLVTLLLIYFGILHINLFNNPIINNTMTKAVSFEQAQKSCNGKQATSFGSTLVNGTKKMFTGGSNIKKDLLKLNKKLIKSKN